MHGIGIVVLNTLMNCATKYQNLLASTPCSHKSHMIILVTVHDFIFQLRMASLMNCETFATMKIAARATTARACDAKQQRNNRPTKPAAGVKISM